RPGLINLDFADVRAVMDEMGKAMMGTGEAEGEDRARQAAEKAIANPLLDEISLNGAKGVLINITGGHDLTLFELDEAASLIREKVDADANIIVGSTLDPSMDGVMRVSVVATGIEASASAIETPVPRRRLAEPLQPPASIRPEEFEHPAEAMAPAAHAPEPAPRHEPRHDPRHEAYPAARSEAPARRMEPQRQQPQGDLHEEYAAEPQLHTTESEDGLPAPAYAARQRAEAARQRAAEARQAAAARAPGTASPEALGRLRQAVQNGPAGSRAVAGQEGHAAAVARPGAGADRARFGINSLLNRMTGHSAEPAARPAPTQRPAVTRAEVRHDPRQDPRMAHHSEPHDPDQERIEIPAFLRRQAN
ncbi:MAG: cell division protein FtsZ, partial [Alkalilacustris sp.]